MTKYFLIFATSKKSVNKRHKDNSTMNKTEAQIVSYGILYLNPSSKLLKQQYTSCMKVGTGGNLNLGREYHKKLFEPLFYSWWNCPYIY